MDSTDHVIHLGTNPYIGVLGIHCTPTHLNVYSYKDQELGPIYWDEIKEFRLNHDDEEVKITLLPECVPLRIKLNEPGELINDLLALGCINKFEKWFNTKGNMYYKANDFKNKKAQNKRIQITEQDFEDHKEIAEIAGEVLPMIGIPLPKKTFAEKALAFLGYVLL